MTKQTIITGVTHKCTKGRHCEGLGLDWRKKQPEAICSGAPKEITSVVPPS